MKIHYPVGEKKKATTNYWTAESAQSFGLSTAGMLLIAACHVGFAAAIYQELQSQNSRMGSNTDHFTLLLDTAKRYSYLLS